MPETIQVEGQNVPQPAVLNRKVGNENGVVNGGDLINNGDVGYQRTIGGIQNLGNVVQRFGEVAVQNVVGCTVTVVGVRAQSQTDPSTSADLQPEELGYIVVNIVLDEVTPGTDPVPFSYELVVKWNDELSS